MWVARMINMDAVEKLLSKYSTYLTYHRMYFLVRHMTKQAVYLVYQL